MGEEALPRPVARYLAGLPPEEQETLAPLLARVNQALLAEASTPDILAILTASPVTTPRAAEVLIAALARLAHPRTPEILAAHFGPGADKTHRKALKKAFHLLKAQGLEVPAGLLAPAERSAVRPEVSAAPVKGYISRTDGNGNRLVILHLPRQGQAFNLFLALCNDAAGITDAYAVLLSSKETKKYLDSTRQDIPGELVEAPPGFLFKILEDGYQTNPGQSAEAVATYLRARPVLLDRLGPAGLPDLHDLLPRLENPEQYLEQARKLPLEEDFFNWHPDPDILRPWLEKIREIETSPLVLSSEQKVARVEGAIDAALQELYPPEQRRRLGRRLLEMAYYLERTGRPHLARPAQAASLDLERERSRLERENPFLLGLFLVPLRGLYDQEKEGQSPQPETQGRILSDF